MHDYLKLRIKLEAANPNEWDRILSAEIDDDSSIDEKLSGKIMGLDVRDIILTDDSIEATVHFTAFGGQEYSEDGEHQDEDGNSFEFKEVEYEFMLTISPDGTRWEKI